MIAMMLVIASSSITEGNSREVVQQAQQEGKHVLLFFKKDSNPATLQMQQVFDEAAKELDSKVVSTKILQSDPSERSIIKKYELYPIKFKN